jgi:hypothetical protein
VYGGELRPGVPARVGQPKGSVPGVRGALPVPAHQRESRRLPKVSAQHRAPGAEAVREALATLDRGGEAPRIGLVGNTGAGKTVGAHAIAQAYLRSSPGPVIVIDNKAERRYDDLPGAVVFASTSAFAAARPASGQRVWVMRPSLFEGGEVDPEEIAELQWKLAGKHWPSLVLNDELVPHAAKGGQWKTRTQWLQRAFVQGRSHGLAQLWGTTALQGVPLDASQQSHELWVFKTGGVALRILSERDYLIGVPPGTVEGLAGYPLPPAERGEFVRLVSGVPWNGVIYKF